jgi:hypothetical protein
MTQNCGVTIFLVHNSILAQKRSSDCTTSLERSKFRSSRDIRPLESRQNPNPINKFHATNLAFGKQRPHGASSRAYLEEIGDGLDGGRLVDAHLVAAHDEALLVREPVL